MKRSDTDLDYLAEIKKGHKIKTQFSGDYNPISATWKYSRALMNATRLNGMFLFRPYTTAMHCYYTGLLFMESASVEHIMIRPKEVDFVMRHDMLEVITGDVLLPVKIHSSETKRKWEEIEAEIVEAYPELRSFTDEYAEAHFPPRVYNLFKACDLWELLIFCEEEYRMGNYEVRPVIDNCCKLLPEFGFGSIIRYVDSL